MQRLVPVLLLCLASLLALSRAGAPEQVHISLTGKPEEILVVWMSPDRSDPSQVQIGLAPGVYQTTVSGNTTNYDFNGYSSGAIHFTKVKELFPSTKYFYRVGGNGIWSKEFHFVTAPAPGQLPLTFAVTGDVGADSNSNDTLMGIANDPAVSMVFHVGDLSYANGRQPIWDDFGKILEPLAAYTPYMPLVGNHENYDHFIPFSYRYALHTLEMESRGSDFYYSFDFGGIHFVALSSETDYSATSSQFQWLEFDLASVDRNTTPWVIVGWHRPWYNTNHAHHNEGNRMRLTMEPVFNKYKVDIGFSGHVHAYERCHSVRNETVTAGAPYYFTIGDGGTPEGLATGWYKQESWSAFRSSAKWGSGRLDVRNATHALWTWNTNDGMISDSFWIVRHR